MQLVGYYCILIHRYLLIYSLLDMPKWIESREYRRRSKVGLKDDGGSIRNTASSVGGQTGGESGTRSRMGRIN